MMALQPQIALLDKFVIQQESIPNFIHPSLQQNIVNIKENKKNEIFTNIV